MHRSLKERESNPPQMFSAVEISCISVWELKQENPEGLPIFPGYTVKNVVAELRSDPFLS